jgi:quinol monooxygenase YgiN
MILRVFRARSRPDSAGELEIALQEHSVPLMRSTEGLLAWWVGRPLGEAGEFVVVTVWRDLATLQAFAGPEWQSEGVIPAAELPLLDSTILHHYEVIESSG